MVTRVGSRITKGSGLNAEAFHLKAEVDPLDRLLARAVFVVGPDNTVKYVEYVKEIAEDPNYEAALAAAAK